MAKKRATPVKSDRFYILSWDRVRDDIDFDSATYLISTAPPGVEMDGCDAYFIVGESDVSALPERIAKIFEGLIGVTGEVKKHLRKEMCFAEVNLVKGVPVVRKLRYTNVEPVIEEVT